MKQSESIKEISAAFAKFAAEKPVIKKDHEVNMKGTSKGGNEYKVNYEYAPLEVLQEACQPVLGKHGLFVTQMIGIAYETTGIFTRIGHASGEYFESFWPVNLESVTKEQDRGSKLTFNKRYAYAAALDLALTNEDNDAVGVENEKKAPSNNVKHFTIPEIYTKKQYPQDMLTNPADFVVNFGKKFKGMKLSQIPVQSIDESLDYWLKQAKTDALHGDIRAFVVNANEYLITKGVYPPDKE
jgi:hypothetical protein